MCDDKSILVFKVKKITYYENLIRKNIQRNQRAIQNDYFTLQSLTKQLKGNSY